VAANLPEGLRLLSCEPIAAGEGPLSRIIRGVEYRVELPEGAPDVARRLAEFAETSAATVVREREGKQPITIDLKKAVEGLTAEDGHALRFTLRAGENEAVARPSEILSALFGAEWTRPGVARIVRERALFGPPLA
jgi:Fe2+ transport system protein FeoA